MLLKNFIQEFKEKFAVDFKSGFWGDLERICESLKDPTFHPSMKLKATLNEFLALEHEPLKIAVIGQFSSGKSTFLNTLLGREILPTGVVPVTAKATYIKYAPNELLNVTYNDGRSEILDICGLGEFVDQRKDLKKIKNITIYSNNEILKRVTFIDTPGLNSRSNADTKETLRIFKEAFGVLWISLIDNAARASEMAEISALPEILRQNSVMLLSQKDRLNAEEIERVLGHSGKTLGEFFAEILPISSKLEKENGGNSGFDLVRNFITSLEAKREEFAILKLKEILNLLKFERANYIKIYDELEKIIAKNGEIFADFSQNLENYSQKFEQFYSFIKEISTNVSEIMNSCVKSEQKSYFMAKKGGIFSQNGFEKIDYEAPNFNKDEALSKLIYNDTKLSDEFRRLKFRLGEFKAEILSAANENYEKMQNEILLFKGKFESFSREDEIFSIEETAVLNKIAGEVYELFLKNYEREFFEFCQKTHLFFDKILIKIVTNYENAIILTADFIANKVQKAVSDYEGDPGVFSLYYPKFEDFSAVLLKNLHYYEFENEFLGSTSFIKKAMGALKEQISQITQKNLSYTAKLKISQQSIFDRLENLSKSLENQS